MMIKKVFMLALFLATTQINAGGILQGLGNAVEDTGRTVVNAAGTVVKGTGEVLEDTGEALTGNYPRRMVVVDPQAGTTPEVVEQEASNDEDEE